MILNYLICGIILIQISLIVGLTENQILDHIKFLSQTSDGIKPSRLRAFLLADLKRALPNASKQEINFTTDADLKVTQNCICEDYSCASYMINHGKRSRIQRSCEDYCCRRSYSLVKKSLNYDEQNNWTKQNDCQLSSPDIESIKISGLAQIFNTKTKLQKQPICVGSLIHPQVVMTTIDCGFMQSKKRLQIKIRETVDKYQYRYQIRNVTKKIIPENYSDLMDKFGFNIVLLVLNKEIDINNEITTTCLSNASSSINLGSLKCFAVSLENKNGRIIEKRQSVVILNSERCLSNNNKTNICTGLPFDNDIEITSNGAPLFCVTPISNKIYYNSQYGMLMRSNQSFKNRRLFSNVSYFKDWIEKNLKLL